MTTHEYNSTEEEWPVLLSDRSSVLVELKPSKGALEPARFPEDTGATREGTSATRQDVRELTRCQSHLVDNSECGQPGGIYILSDSSAEPHSLCITHAQQRVRQLKTIKKIEVEVTK